ncbi:Proteasome_activator pa28 beta subunit [Hexamita inflata]|uniref:Proteasome activator pa28 beta subunit n=1 Tax=Hexamita inflata TaxID=28002 RepID=A0AA86PS64_9EUKA|nr:Proteasome activator pa28 beta subunit [Hexamita inflata]CAI9941260.1 Proteasome activator pa28 beta subunit [Hexamita inflata]CAI9945194.1 Proteasome activator pa28 beta subunit [Hexamita inflata]
MKAAPETQIMLFQMEKRAELLGQEAEQLIYVMLPQKAVDLQEILKSNKYFQQSFIQQLQQQLNEKLLPKTSDTIDMNPIIDFYSEPLPQIYEFEDFVRENIREILKITEQIKAWITVCDASEDQLQYLSDIVTALTQTDDIGNQLIQRILSFHSTRQRLFNKLTKRKLFDVAKTLVQHDIGQVTEIQNGFGELYNQLIIGYDVTIKNFERYRRIPGVKGFEGMY